MPDAVEVVAKLDASTMAAIRQGLCGDDSEDSLRDPTESGQANGGILQTQLGIRSWDYKNIEVLLTRSGTRIGDPGVAEEELPAVNRGSKIISGNT